MSLATKDSAEDYVKARREQERRYKENGSKALTEFFPHTRGGFTIYVGGRDDAIVDVRFVLGFFGEEPQLIIEQFWKEHRGDFVLVPVFAYGGVPRRELCTQRSLIAALQTVDIGPGSFTEMKWKKLCQDMSVAWPKRLQGTAA